MISFCTSESHNMQSSARGTSPNFVWKGEAGCFQQKTSVSLKQDKIISTLLLIP